MTDHNDLISENAKLLLELRKRAQRIKEQEEETILMLAELEGVPVPVVKTEAIPEKRKLPSHFKHRRSHWIPIR